MQSICMIETHEFRRFVLFLSRAPNLTDKDIPKRGKFRYTILDKFKIVTDEIRAEIQVCLISILLYSNMEVLKI